jgi:cytoskeletal protein CcmA (bactofilin family)
MVFRRDSKIDAFQRQISALRHQLGGEHEEFEFGGPEFLDRRTSRNDGHLAGLLPVLDSESFDSDASSLARSRDQREQDLAHAPVPAIDMETSVIAHSAKWTGDVSATGSLHVYGQVQGTLTARDRIFVAAEAEVDATISAATVTIAGSVRGSIQCAERFEILPDGRVTGDVCAPSLVIHDGALMSGQVSMTRIADVRTQVTAAGGRGARGGD